MKAQRAAEAVETNLLACTECGAGLPPHDARGNSSCFYCGAQHRADRSSEILAITSGYEAPARDRESSHDGEEAARIPMTEDAVLRLLREQFADAESVFLCPHLPPRKERLVREAHGVHLPDNERILALHDASWLGHGTEGFLVTARRLCWKNPSEPACSVAWRDLDPELLYVDRRSLFVSSVAALRIEDDAVLESAANAFHVLALSALPARPASSGVAPARDTHSDALRGDGPPPTLPPGAGSLSFRSFVSYAEEPTPDRCCWHCRTPLFATTPQCGYCGVLPKKRGWSRIG
jgi:hypothetical protein